MPSPLGHALGGAIAGWLVADAPAPRDMRQAGRWPNLAASTLAFAVAGLAADADLLVGTHNTWSHSVGATGLVGLAAFAARGRGHARFALALAAAYGSHVLLDWLGHDASAPRGIMALWPFSPSHWNSGLDAFAGIERRTSLEAFWHNLGAVVREACLLEPVAWLVWWGKLRGAREASPSQP